MPALLFGLAAVPLPEASSSLGLAGITPSVSAAFPRPIPGGNPAGVQPPMQEPSAALPAHVAYSRFDTQRLAHQSLVHQDRARPGVVAEWQPGLKTALRGIVFHPEIKNEMREVFSRSLCGLS